jgi:PTH1 family peptidyl-tRNA hydrolase
VIVAGLGNPGARYEGTRHNIGFAVVDLIAERWGRPAFREKFRAHLALAELPAQQGVEKVYLLKPQTFMNLSGESVQPAAAFFRHAPSDILVIHDELDLPLGRLQLREGGGAGGHNGLKSVTSQLGTPGYKRLRCGIGRPPVDFRGTPADFVLQAFAPFEGPEVQALVSRAADAVELLVKHGMATAMNQTNRRNS